MLVVDATVGLQNQDLRIATEAWEQGCGLIVVVNKWDLVEEKDANTARRGQEELIAKAPFLRYVPFVYPSALTGQRVRKVLDLILEVAEAREQRVPTAEVNRVLASPAGAQRAAAEAGRGGEAALRLADRHRAADVRDREQPAARRAGVLPALPGERLSRGLAVHGVAAADSSSPAGARSGERRRALARGLVPRRRDPDQLPRGSRLPRHRPAGARQQESRRHQRLSGAGLEVRDSRRRWSTSPRGRCRCWSSRRRSPTSQLFALACGVAAIVGHVLLRVRPLQGREGRGDGRGGDVRRSTPLALLVALVVWACWCCAERLRLARRASRRPRRSRSPCTCSSGPTSRRSSGSTPLVAAAIIWLIAPTSGACSTAPRAASAARAVRAGRSR